MRIFLSAVNNGLPGNKSLAAGWELYFGLMADLVLAGAVFLRMKRGGYL